VGKAITEATVTTNARQLRRVAIVGNPNTGKSTLFNRLSGLRQRTANFPGTTQEAHVGFLREREGEPTVELIDLPGVYSLSLSNPEADVCRRVIDGELMPAGERVAKPDAACVVVDATNLPRNLGLVVEVLAHARPTVVAINMVDAARQRAIHADEDELARRLGCPVVVCSGRTGEGVDRLREILRVLEARPEARDLPRDSDDIDAFVRQLCTDIRSREDRVAPDRLTDRVDGVLTHPLWGLGAFAIVMGALFWVIFALAAYPMDAIDLVFALLGGLVERTLPPGILQDLLVDGVVAGVGATVIFLPQIMLLFFLISILEGTGYLARAALLMDRLLRPFGLSGHAFVPLLSAHACAIPAIMSARGVPGRRDRLATILVAPFMSCTARIPVYVLLTVLLFPGSPALQALAFAGCYALGVVAGVLSALIARRTILRGDTMALAIELPRYRWPSIRTAAITAWDRGLVFLRKAGTVILAISIVLWWLGSYPIVDPPPEAVAMRTQAAQVHDESQAAALTAEADALEASHQAERSFIGRIGSAVQPVFAPLGYDRQLTVGVLASFAAREVFVTTMAVVATGSEDVEDQGVLDALATAKRDDGTLIFTAATSWSLLVYFVLAMQCLPTLAVTAREAGGWKWAGLQLAWMFGLAYAGAFATFQIMRMVA
jgi:ferrous iron transport protein B